MNRIYRTRDPQLPRVTPGPGATPRGEVYRAHMLAGMRRLLDEAEAAEDEYAISELRMRLAVLEGCEGLDIETIGRRLAEALANDWRGAIDALNIALVAAAQPHTHEEDHRPWDVITGAPDRIRFRRRGEGVPSGWMPTHWRARRWR